MIIVTVVRAGHKERKRGRGLVYLRIPRRKEVCSYVFRLGEQSRIEMPRRDDGRAREDYRESSKIVIHRSRPRVEREPTIISLITGFLEGERASNGGSTNPDETGPRANAEWNGIQPTRFSTSPATNCSFRIAVYPEIVLTASVFANVRFESFSLRFVEMEFGDSLEINDRAKGNVFKFSSSLGFLSKNFFIFRKGIEEYCIHLNKSSVCPQFSRRSHSFHLFFCPNFIGNTVAIFRWKLKFQKLLHRKRSAICTGKLISRFDETR